MEQKIIGVRDNLLKKDGTLNHIGYSKTFLLNYNKEDIKNKNRVKEWDYYYISDSRYGLCLTISNLSFAGVISASVIDFYEPKDYNKTSLLFFPKDKVVLPKTSKEGISYLKTKDAEFTFEVKEGVRLLKGIYKNFYGKGYENSDLEFEIELTKEPKESIVKSTPFKNKKHFYYNQKINCMIASGHFTVNGRVYEFNKSNSLATLDWGRGVLPYSTLWYWASMQTKHTDGKMLGFNLGKALGDNTEATENCIFYNGKTHKLGDVRIKIQREGDKRDYMGTWTFYSDDRRLELVFEPIIDRYAPFNALVLAFIPHQVFGKYTGKLILDDGKEIEIKDVLGFAERVVNRW